MQNDHGNEKEVVSNRFVEVFCTQTSGWGTEIRGALVALQGRLPAITLGMHRPFDLVLLSERSAELLLPANAELPLELASAPRLLRVGSIHSPAKPPWRWRRHK
jgi:hypothetical protein